MTYQELIKNKKANQIRRKKICIYCGITLLIRDPQSINHIISNPVKFKLKGMHDMVTGDDLGVFEGKYKNFRIRTGGNKRGVGVFIGGSLHKWKNATHNHDTFYWYELLKVLAEIANEFQFNPEEVDVCSVEGGLNILFGPTWKYKARQIPKNTILFKGEPKSSVRKKMPNGGYQLEMEKGECTDKMYDKGRHYKLSYEVLRYEKRFLKFRSSGIRLFSNLLDVNLHDALGRKLLETFETIIIFQPEILDNGNLFEQERQFLLEHQNEHSWLRLRKERKYHGFRKRVKEYDRLITKYCPINYKTEILQLMKLQLK